MGGTKELVTPQEGIPMEPRIIIAASALAVAGLVLTALSATALGSAKAAAKWPSAERPALGVTASRIGLVLGVLLCGSAAGLAMSVIRTPSLPGWIALIVGAALLTLAVIAWAGLAFAGRLELSALINSPSPMTGGTSAAANPAGPQGTPRIAYGQPYPGMVSPEAVARPPASPAAFSASSVTESYADDVNTTTAQNLTAATRSDAETAGPLNIPYARSPERDKADPTVPDEALPGWVYTDDAENWYLVTSISQGRRLVRLTDFSLTPPGEAEGELRLAGSVEMMVWPAGAQREDPEEASTDEVEPSAEVDDRETAG